MYIACMHMCVYIIMCVYIYIYILCLKLGSPLRVQTLSLPPVRSFEFFVGKMGSPYACIMC